MYLVVFGEAGLVALQASDVRERSGGDDELSAPLGEIDPVLEVGLVSSP
jgi:hypothetical protein